MFSPFSAKRRASDKDLPVLSKCQNHKADCANFCDLLRKAELYYVTTSQTKEKTGNLEIQFFDVSFSQVLPI
jgi:hypothetical protein